MPDSCETHYEQHMIGKQCIFKIFSSLSSAIPVWLPCKLLMWEQH